MKNANSKIVNSACQRIDVLHAPTQQCSCLQGSARSVPSVIVSDVRTSLTAWNAIHPIPIFLRVMGDASNVGSGV